MLAKETEGWEWEQAFCLSTVLIVPRCLCSTCASFTVRSLHPTCLPSTSALPVSLLCLSSNPQVHMLMHFLAFLCFTIAYFTKIYMPRNCSKAIVLLPSIISHLLLEVLEFLTVGGTFIKRLKILFPYSGIFLPDFSPLFFLSPSQFHGCLQWSDRHPNFKCCHQHFKYCLTKVSLRWVGKHSMYNPSGILELSGIDTKLVITNLIQPVTVTMGYFILK